LETCPPHHTITKNMDYGVEMQMQDVLQYMHIQAKKKLNAKVT